MEIDPNVLVPDLETAINAHNDICEEADNFCRQIKSLFLSNQLEELNTVYNEMATNPAYIMVQCSCSWSFYNGTTPMDDQFISYMVNMYHNRVHTHTTYPRHLEVRVLTLPKPIYGVQDITDQYVDNNYVLK